MRILRTFVLPLLILSLASSARAEDEANFTAKVDRPDITLDDSVTLKFNVQIEGSASIGRPDFSAPDFQVVNEYTGTFVESYYENGRFGMRNNQQFTKVLKPLKTGDFKIDRISVHVGKKIYTAEPIEIHVAAGGAGTPPPRGYGSGGVGLRGSGKVLKGSAFFVRAEVDKQKVYKGEQIIVSYYLYMRSRTMNIEVVKYPVLGGFLREDLDMPVLQQRLDPESVVLDGVPYQRALLLRYAAYPLKEGKLPIDQMTLKANYYTSHNGNNADEDPFSQFFQQMVPRQAVVTSDPLTIDVSAVPADDKPIGYSGGVGDFKISASVDRFEVRAGEPVTVTLKVEGKGNLAAVEEPKLQLPQGVELYDSKGQTKNGHGGVGEKDFEFLLIPRIQGKLVVPPIEMSFFDPVKRTYVTRTSETFTVNVLEGAPGSNVASAPKNQGILSQPSTSSTPSVQDIRGPKGMSMEAPAFSIRRNVLYWIYAAALLFFGLGAVSILVDQMRRKKQFDPGTERRAKREKNVKEWQRLRQNARIAQKEMPFQDVVATYERLTGLVYDALDGAYGLGARGLARGELRELLVENNQMPDQLWQRTSELLEFAETVRYASSVGAVSEITVRTDLEKWVKEGQALENDFLKLYK